MIDRPLRLALWAAGVGRSADGKRDSWNKNHRSIMMSRQAAMESLLGQIEQSLKAAERSCSCIEEQVATKHRESGGESLSEKIFFY